MVKQNFPKSQMRDRLRLHLEAAEMEPSTLKKRNSQLSGLIRFMDGNKLDDYTPEIGLRYLSYYHSLPKMTYSGLLNVRTLIFLLDDIYNDIPYRCHKKHADYQMYGSMASIAEEYFRHLKVDLRLSDITIKRYRCILSHFTQKMSMLGITWSTLDYSHVVDFLASIKNSKAHTYTCVRCLLKFAFKRGCTPQDLSLFLKSACPHRKEVLPSYYSADEVMQVENAIDRRSNIGKRDYAIVLLASRLGMRSSDIRLLTFKNLDWDHNEISFVQYKTGNALHLPLLAEVGDAIIDYVKNARPTCDSKNVFLTCGHPYRPCNSTTISCIVKKYFVSSRVDCKGRHTGSHALRHSLATIMLENGTTLPVISGVLGHETSESTMYYLGVDIKSLLKCSLDVPIVDESFYLQEGGILYE